MNNVEWSYNLILNVMDRQRKILDTKDNVTEEDITNQSEELLVDYARLLANKLEYTNCNHIPYIFIASVTTFLVIMIWATK